MGFGECKSHSYSRTSRVPHLFHISFIALSPQSPSLKKRRNALLLKPKELQAFDEHLPYDYRHNMFYDVTKDYFTPAPNHSYHKLPPVHQDAFNKLGPRLYYACIEALDHAEWPASADNPTQQDGTGTDTVYPALQAAPIARRPEADAALLTAVEHFATYPERPARPLRRSKRAIARAIDEVRQVLARAPRAPRRRTGAWGNDVDMLDFDGEPSPGHYEWDSQYLGEVFGKLCALVEKDPSAWKGIRWEVYDKVRSVTAASYLSCAALTLVAVMTCLVHLVGFAAHGGAI